MPKLQTRYFHELEYSEQSVFEFPFGIPGFEDHTAFLFVEQPQNKPLVFMQSLKDPGLCFLTLPVGVVEPGYQLDLAQEECASLGLPPGKQPVIGNDVSCVALLTVSQDADPTVNLMSPIVVNLHNRKGMQAIQMKYSLRHPLALEAAPCS